MQENEPKNNLKTGAGERKARNIWHQVPLDGGRLDVEPVHQNQGEGTGGYHDPEGRTLKKGTKTYVLKRFFVQAGADQKERNGETNSAKAIQ